MSELAPKLNVKTTELEEFNTVNRGYFGRSGAILDAHVLALPGLF